MDIIELICSNRSKQVNTLLMALDDKTVTT